MLKIKPDVKEFTVTGVIFEDNTRDDNIDFVCMATGYIFGFPFLDKYKRYLIHTNMTYLKNTCS
jgi:dimethylaniline monooxygenase (N-oxide forming)